MEMESTLEFLKARLTNEIQEMLYPNGSIAYIRMAITEIIKDFPRYYAWSHYVGADDSMHLEIEICSWQTGALEYVVSLPLVK